MSDVAGPDGGYIQVPLFLVAGTLYAMREGLLDCVRDTRVLFAAIEQRERRLIEARRTKRETEGEFSARELRTLTGISADRIRASLKKLEALGLIRYRRDSIELPADESTLFPEGGAGEFPAFLERLGSGNRLVPFGRRLLRLLMEQQRRASIAVLLSAGIRCLYRYPKKAVRFRFKGTASTKFIEGVSGVSRSAIKDAKAHLESLGVFTLDGSSIEVNPNFERLQGTTESGHPGEQNPTESGHRSPGNKPLAGANKNQDKQTRSFAPDTGLGFCKPRKETRPEPEKTPEEIPAPRLSRIRPEDLRDDERTAELERQATKCGVLSGSEADRAFFWSAAERARVSDCKDACATFNTILKRRLVSHITGDQEDAARRRIKRHYFGAESATRLGDIFGAEPRSSSVTEMELEQFGQVVADYRRIGLSYASNHVAQTASNRFGWDDAQFRSVEKAWWKSRC